MGVSMVADEDPATGSDDGYDLVGVRPQQVGGQFRFFYFDDERWEWSDAVQIMHGYEPGTVSPTTELVLSHKHPDDYQQVANTLDDVRRHHQAFSTRHRIIDTTGRIHHVIVVADKLQDASGEVIGTEASTSTSRQVKIASRSSSARPSPRSPRTARPSNRPRAC